MTDFGFSISNTRQIIYEKNDPKLMKYVEEREISFRSCMVCGVCTATCTAGGFTDFNIRKLNVLIRWGEIEAVDKEIKKCMLCGKCQMACPRGVNTRSVIKHIHQGIQKIRNHEI